MTLTSMITTAEDALVEKAPPGLVREGVISRKGKRTGRSVKRYMQLYTDGSVMTFRSSKVSNNKGGVCASSSCVSPLPFSQFTKWSMVHRTPQLHAAAQIATHAQPPRSIEPPMMHTPSTGRAFCLVPPPLVPHTHAPFCTPLHTHIYTQTAHANTYPVVDAVGDILLRLSARTAYPPTPFYCHVT